MIHENSIHYANSRKQKLQKLAPRMYEYIKKFMRKNKNLPCLLSSYKQTGQQLSNN